MPYINVDEENSTSVDLYYEDYGSGQPVVLIHGFPLSGVAWEKIVLELLKAGYRIITYDRRGFGKSSRPIKGYNYDIFAADLDNIIKKLDLHDVVLIGHSMGTGEITRYLSGFGSDRVSRAVFISPIPPFLLKTNDNPSGVDQSVFDGILKSISEDRLAYLSKFFGDFYNLNVTLGNRVSKEVVQYSWSVAAGASPVATAACVPTWLTDFREDIPHIDVPLLVIQGDDDRILPFPITGKRLHEEVKGSQLVVLKGGSHGICWTHAGEINQELLKFLGQVVVEKSVA